MRSKKNSLQMGSIKCVLRGKYNVLPIAPDRKVICWKCNKAYKRKETLLQHIRVKHLKKLVHCSWCTKQFISSSTLNRHTRNKHGTNGLVNDSLQKLSCDMPIPDQYDESKERTTNGDGFQESETILTQEPTESLSYNSSFPSLANVLSLSENEFFGHHVVAKCDINVGEVIIISDPFATIECLSSKDSRCFECGRAQENTFSKCQHCNNVFFCSENCRSSSKIHRSKCDTLFQQNDTYVIRLTTQIMKNAFDIAEKSSTFTDTVKDILYGERNHRKCQPPLSVYGEVLNLKGFVEDDHMMMARRVVECLSGLYEMESVGGMNWKRLLLHIASRHIATIKTNVFSEEITLRQGICTRYSIHDVLSRLNHSCVPNVHHYYEDGMTIRGMTARPIKKGEQIFINYLGEMKFGETISRQRYIKEVWSFDCNCDMCHNNIQANQLDPFHSSKLRH